MSCARCASEYVGSTTRTLHTVAEHAGRSFITGSVLSVPPHSMVRTHSESCGVPVTLDDICIIGYSSSAIDLHILKSMHIFKLQPVLNKFLSIKHCEDLVLFYISLCVFSFGLCVCFLIVMSTF